MHMQTSPDYMDPTEERYEKDFATHDRMMRDQQRANKQSKIENHRQA